MNDDCDGAGPADWSHFYEHAPPAGRSRRLPCFADASSAAPAMPVQADPAAAEERGRRPARKRSRTSRRAPTTLLNTDASNFRAMVQQFTGVPSVPYTTSYVPGGVTTLNFGIGFDHPETIPTSFHSHHHQQQQQQEERYSNMMSPQFQYRRPPQQEMIGFGIGGNIENDLLQGLENPREVGLVLPDGFFLDGGQLNPNRLGAENNNRGTAGGYFL